MALDTEARRRMALGMASGVGVILPPANGLAETTDRATLLGVFYGIEADLYRESFEAGSGITRSSSMNSIVTRSLALNSKLDD